MFGRASALVSVIAISCGTILAVRRAVLSIVGRACPGIRCVVVSKKDASKAISVVGGCTGGVTC